MASCKDCLSYDVCEMKKIADENYPERHYTENNNCDHFKERSKFVELPRKVGDTVYFIDEKIEKTGSRKKFVEFVNHGEIDHIAIGCSMMPVFTVCTEENKWFELFSDDMFFVKEQAEKALEEREQN